MRRSALPSSAVRQRADRVEVLEREAQRIHDLVADGARRVRPVLFHPLAQRVRLAVVLVFLERRHVGRRRQRRRAEQVVQDPFAAHHRRGSIGVRGDHEDAALPEQTLPRFVGHGHAAKLAAVHVRDPVVLRDAFVHERVVGGHQVEHVAVLAHDAAEEQLRLVLQTLPQVVVEIGKLVLVGLERRAGCAGTATGRRNCSTSASARSSASIRRTCCSRTAGSFSRPFAASVDELVVGNAAPEKERQPRCQLDVADRGMSLPATAPAGSVSTRNENFGLARMARSASSMPCSNVPSARPVS